MAASVRQQQDTPVQSFYQDTFAGGINTSAPSDRIADNECFDILNFEYDSEDQLISRSGVQQFLDDAYSYTGRITSIHYHEDNAANIHVLFTNDNKLYRTDNVGVAPTDVTSGLTFPSDTFWQWKMFNGKSIGVNKGSSSFDNPISVSGGGPTVAVLSADAPPAKYIEIWNSRVWLVGSENPNTVYASALGNETDWTTTGAAGIVTIDIDKNDGDRITGLIAFRQRLFVFKRTKIYVISATSEPNTDPDNLRVDIFTNNIGCVSAYTIRTVLDDVLYLSETGIASLASSEAVDDFTSALVSRNVKDLGRIDNQSDEIASHIFEASDQYIIGVLSNLSFSNTDEAFVLDYKRIQNRIIRWVRFNGRLAGSAYGSIYVNGNHQYLIGAKDTGNTYRLYKYIPKDTSIVQDETRNFTKSIITKAFNLQLPLYRKLYHRFGLAVQALQEELNFTVQYFYDQILTRTGSYSFALDAQLVGALWDSAVWDTDFWDTGNAQFFRVWRRFKNNQFGRKAVNVSFYLTNESNQVMIVNSIQFEYNLLNYRQVRNA